jgi:invasion protein IalB
MLSGNRLKPETDMTTMHPTRFAALLALALPLAAPLAAQETAPEAPAEAPADDPAADLDLGTPVDTGEPAVGEPYTRETFGDWSLRCLNAAEGPDPCQLYQLLFDADGNSVAEMTMFPLPEGSRAAAGATIVAPLETLLTEQVVISVDGGTAKTYPFTFCNQAGCVARVGFTAEDIAAFKAGTEAMLRIVPAVAPDQVVELTISLVGFTAGYDFQVEAGNEAPAE